MVSWPHKKHADGTDAPVCPECDSEVDATHTYCPHCGYDIVKQAKIDLTQQPRVN